MIGERRDNFLSKFADADARPVDVVVIADESREAQSHNVDDL